MDKPKYLLVDYWLYNIETEKMETWGWIKPEDQAMNTFAKLMIGNRTAIYLKL
jgi:hypothetical protein